MEMKKVKDGIVLVVWCLVFLLALFELKFPV